jgi:hypothetical protein
MAINGLTDKDAAFPSLGVLRKGEKKTDENKPGKDLTYFRFVSEDDLANQIFFSAYPSEDTMRNINVYLPYKTTQENMIDGTWIEKWIAGGLVYRSDGEKIVLWRTPKGGFSTEQKPDPKPEVLEDGKRADGSLQVGRLTVIIPELGRLMTVTVLTTSKWDIINLTRQLRSYEALEGDLRGIPFVLRRKLETISTPMKGGKRARRQKWLLSIETLPRYTMPKIAAMERAALPASVDSEIIDSNDYTVHELPLNAVAPFEDEVLEPVPTQEAPKAPTPEPAQAASKPTNGNGDVPRTPQVLLETINRRVEATYDNLYHIENAIRKELGKGWKWPKNANDVAGWKAAYDAAYGHAMAKIVPVEGEQLGLIDDAQLDEAFPRGGGATYED